jgi:DNA-binding IclR family transcriptional regulator
MHELSRESEQSCHLAVLSGANVLVVLQVDSPLPMRYAVALGSRHPLLRTSSGRIFLSLLPPSKREELLAAIPEEVAEFGGVDRVAESLEAIAAAGFDCRESFVVRGMSNLAFPVRDHLGDCIASLTIPFMSWIGHQVTISDAAVLLGAAAVMISRELGARVGDYDEQLVRRIVTETFQQEAAPRPRART